MSTLTRYILFQLPGWAIAALVVLLSWHVAVLPAWAALALFLAWVLKDFALYPLLRVAYTGGTRTGAEQLIGSVGVARDGLAPTGYVSIRGELWRAEVEPPGRVITRGTHVRVRAVRGLTLIVDAAVDHLGPDAPAGNRPRASHVSGQKEE